MSDPRLRLRLYFDNGLMLGPGKADLLSGIAAHGSISAAGRAMGMSYKRAWSLVEEMNAAFREPLVASTRGGAQGGGAHLTDAGRKILSHYRNLVDEARSRGQADIAEITALLAPKPAGEGDTGPSSGDMSA